MIVITRYSTSKGTVRAGSHPQHSGPSNRFSTAVIKSAVDTFVDNHQERQHRRTSCNPVIAHTSIDELLETATLARLRAARSQLHERQLIYYLDHFVALPIESFYLPAENCLDD
jgi:hypothetical protein